MSIWRLVARLALGCCALLAGCDWGQMGARNMYGVYLPPQPHDPTVTLDSLSYTPASPIRIGDTLQLTATASHATVAGYVVVIVDKGHHDTFAVALRDDGQAPDDVAADGVWRGAAPWPAQFGTCSKALLTAYLRWYDGADGGSLRAPNLTVLPAEEGGQP